MPEIKREFGTMYFRVKGDSGEAVVLLHDYFGTHRGWITQQLELSRFFVTVAPDLRGHGRSILKHGSLEISAMSGDIIAILDSLEIERAHLVGCSHGAVVAMDAARRHPDRIASIVVTSVPDLDDPEVLEYGRTYVDSVFPRIELDLEQLHGAGTSGYVRDILLPVFADSLDNPPEDHLDALRLAHEIPCPVLVLAGDSDPVMTPERALRLKRQIRTANLSILPNTGHLAHQESPLLYTETLLDHLLRCQSK